MPIRHNVQQYIYIQPPRTCCAAVSSVSALITLNNTPAGAAVAGNPARERVDPADALPGVPTGVLEAPASCPAAGGAANAAEISGLMGGMSSLPVSVGPTGVSVSTGAAESKACLRSMRSAGASMLPRLVVGGRPPGSITAPVNTCGWWVGVEVVCMVVWWCGAFHCFITCVVHGKCHFNVSSHVIRCCHPHTSHTIPCPQYPPHQEPDPSSVAPLQAPEHTPATEATQ